MNLAAFRLASALAIAGTVGVFARESGVTAAEAVFWRCAIGFAAMAVYVQATDAWRGAFAVRRDLGLTVLGGAAIVVNWVLIFEAFERISISLATIVYQVQPFFLLGLTRVFMGERLTGRQLAWVAAAFAGLVLAVGGDAGLAGDAASLWAGVLLALGAAFLYGVAVASAKAIQATKPAAVTLAHTAIGALLLWPVARPSFAVFADPAATGWLAGLGVIHTGLVYVLMYGAYPRLAGASIAVLSFVYPVASILVDAAVYGTRIALVQYAGMALIAMATLAVNRRVA
jgi:drug/metabolite transporter (DMT)-like permease